MPVRQVRRIRPPIGESLYDQMAAQALHALYWRGDLDAIGREHAELIIRRGPNVLLAQRAGDAKLAYSYESDAAFFGLFPEMFETLLPRICRELRAENVRFRLSHAPSRPLVEPVLKKLWFLPRRDWMEFEFARSTGLPKAAAPSRMRFREGTVADAEAIARIDHECFPNTPAPVSSIRSRLDDGRQRALLALRGSEVVGFCTWEQPDPGEGYIETLAVAEAARGQGVGAALTARALRQLFAGGVRRVSLTTDEDDSAAIRLYVKLGFRQRRAGRDYVRPTDPKAVERVRKQSLGTLIKFGGWR